MALADRVLRGLDSLSMAHTAAWWTVRRRLSRCSCRCSVVFSLPARAVGVGWIAPARLLSPGLNVVGWEGAGQGSGW